MYIYKLKSVTGHGHGRGAVEQDVRGGCHHRRQGEQQQATHLQNSKSNNNFIVFYHGFGSVEIRFIRIWIQPFFPFPFISLLFPFL